MERPVSSTFGSWTNASRVAADVGVAGRLAAGKCPRVAAEIWQMLCNCLRCRQESLPNMRVDLGYAPINL